ncbi:8036_t:CDS:2, partial [Cetraspora pellucida]
NFERPSGSTCSKRQRTEEQVSNESADKLRTSTDNCEESKKKSSKITKAQLTDEDNSESLDSKEETDFNYEQEELEDQLFGFFKMSRKFFQYTYNDKTEVPSEMNCNSDSKSVMSQYNNCFVDLSAEDLSHYFYECLSTTTQYVEQDFAFTPTNLPNSD